MLVTSRSHLLFTWPDRFGLDRHRRAITELIRGAHQMLAIEVAPSSECQ